jgi:type II secretory pathway pseudopilin PulG
MFAPAPPRRVRPGITLTEILIAIMIMGVGMVSLATLFPLGLLRIRDANRMTRSALLAETAMNDIASRNLLAKPSFLNPIHNPFSIGKDPNTGNVTNFDPCLQDTATPQGLINAPANGYGLPFAYDPLWRASVPNPNYASSPNFNGVGYYTNSDPSEARFAMGLGTVRTDPSGGLPSAHGLQRLTNFNPNLTPPAAPANGLIVLYPNFGGPGTPNTTISTIFVSPEDVVFQSKVDATGTQNPNISSVVPDMTFTGGVATTNDWRYTWMFTGFQTDAEGTIFEGDIVIFENRPFSIDPATTSNAPYGSQMYSPWQVSGETVVEAVFGFSPVAPLGYGQGADKVVLLRWPNTMPDPDVKISSWIADVTYERNQVVSNTRFGALNPALNNTIQLVYPGQRCYWYQVVKRSTPADEGTGVGLGVTGYRAMTVWVNAPLRAKTQISNGMPVYVNAALVDPYVVNTFPRTVYMR